MAINSSEELRKRVDDIGFIIRLLQRLISTFTLLSSPIVQFVAVLSNTNFYSSIICFGQT